jgi:hypothetical protein
MSQEKTSVSVVNNSLRPVSNLIVAHWQEIRSDYSEWDESFSRHEYNSIFEGNKALFKWSFEIVDEAKHNN